MLDTQREESERLQPSVCSKTGRRGPHSHSAGEETASPHRGGPRGQCSEGTGHSVAHAPTVKGAELSFGCGTFPLHTRLPELRPTRTPCSSALRAPSSASGLRAPGPLQRCHHLLLLHEQEEAGRLPNRGGSRAGLAQHQEGWGVPPNLRSKKGATPLPSSEPVAGLRGWAQSPPDGSTQQDGMPSR